MSERHKSLEAELREAHRQLEATRKLTYEKPDNKALQESCKTLTRRVAQLEAEMRIVKADQHRTVNA